ncbi:MAG: integration host factor subunit beta [Kiritimatiellae bacterium]|jgi:Bacterial nucleoid DNA-binding protein|nr:integration host factor subunit beta [Kiritimatiellia bacterium]
MRKDKIKTTLPNGDTLTKRGLAQIVADKTNVKLQDALFTVQVALDAVFNSLINGKRVEFREFGVFEVVTRKARIGRNPRQPDQLVDIPKHRDVRFRPSDALVGSIKKRIRAKSKKD